MKSKKKLVRRLLTTSNKSHARLKRRRPIHKKVLLHPAAVFLLLCVGVLLVGSSWNAKAYEVDDTASYSVHGRVPAPPLTEPALITSASAGQHFSSTPLEISGSCPDKSYVKIYRNDIFAGVVICNNLSFDPLVELVPGQNTLQVHVFNITDDEGPLSGPVIVYYDPPINAPNSRTPTTTPAANPFLITSQYRYVGYPTHQEIGWQITTAGGAPPYGFTVKWGDGQESTYVQAAAGPLLIKHSYSSAGDFVIDIFGTDSDGNSAYLQLVAIVNGRTPLQFFGVTSGPLAQLSSYTKKWLWAVWPAYIILVLMAVSFWLGERQELRILKAKRRTSRRR